MSEIKADRRNLII